MIETYRVFDAHTHVGEWGTWEMKGNQVSPFEVEFSSKEKLEEHMEKYHIERQVVMPHYHPETEITMDTNGLAVGMAELEGVMAAVFFLPSRKERLEEIIEMVEEKNVVAFKTSADAWERGTYDPGTWNGEQRDFMETLLDIARERDLPVQLHTGSDASSPGNLFALADSFPGLKYHCVHMGGTAGGHFSFVPGFLERLESHELYCDTSWARGFGVRWMARELQERDSLERMLFASDEPWGDFPSEYHKVKGLDLEAEEKQEILFENAAELYG